MYAGNASRGSLGLEVDRIDLTGAAGVVCLMLICGPVIALTGNSAGDVVSATAATLSVPLLLTRLSKAPQILAWALLFCALYGVTSMASAEPAQGLRHTVAAATAAAALALFTAFGADVLQLRWFRRLALALIVVGVLAVNVGSLPKNLGAGAALYLVALLTVILLRRRQHVGLLVTAFFAMAVLMALLTDFRSLVGYAAVLVVAYVGAVRLPKRVYLWAGMLGAIAAVATTLWYFLNVYTSELAMILTRIVVDASGRPATSGRDWLWAGIIDATQTSPIIGLGPGVLPRDILPTYLSAHSFYLQVYMQVGLVGLIVLGFLLLAVWRPLAGSNHPVGQFGSALFLMFVTHNATEVLMFQNGLVVGLPAWCAIGLAVSIVAQSRRTAGDRSEAAKVAPTSASRHRLLQRR